MLHWEKFPADHYLKLVAESVRHVPGVALVIVVQIGQGLEIPPQRIDCIQKRHPLLVGGFVFLHSENVGNAANGIRKQWVGWITGIANCDEGKELLTPDRAYRDEGAEKSDAYLIHIPAHSRRCSATPIPRSRIHAGQK